MLQQVVDPNQYEFEMASADTLVAEIMELVEQRRPRVLFIATLPVGGLAHARHLCKRLKSRFADLKIVVGRWGEKEQLQQHREQLIDSGADYVGGSLSESTQQLAELYQFLRPPQVAPVPAAELSVA
jgi:hypothetical protein